jgi:CheY-like chemotaxis protein
MKKYSITILLVDDDEDDRDFFREALHEINPSVTCLTVGDGEHALEFLAGCDQLPDLIFMDLNMPKMDGKQCLKELKNNSRFEAIPVIIYSTSHIDEDIAEVMALGAADYIQKPSYYHEILTVVSEVLERQ